MKVERKGKMKTSILYGPRDVKVEDKPIPKLTLSDVLVKVKVCGVCGSDVANYRRGSADGTPPPVAIGHEFVGEIVELGDQVSQKRPELKLGDRIVVEPYQPCGTCWSCMNAMPNLCARPRGIGGTDDGGGFSEYCRVNSRFVHRLSDNVSYEEGAFVEPLACALYGLRKMRIAPGDFCVVIGPGPIGLMMLQYIKASGAGKILLIGTRDYRIEVGQHLGADYVMNTSDGSSKYYVKDPLLQIKQWNRGRGADAVIIATGNASANELGINLGGPRSRIVLFGGAGYGPEDAVKVKLWEGTLMDREIIFSWLGPYTFSAAIEAIRDGLVKVKPLITHIYPLDKIIAAIETAESRSGNAIKVLVKPES